MDRHSEDDSSDREGSLLDPNEQGPQEPARKIPRSFNISTFNNEIEKDKEVPEKRCAVCCKLLYPEEYCRLSIDHKKKIEELFPRERRNALKNGWTVAEMEQITWPLLNYRDLNGQRIREVDTHKPKGKGGEYVIVCARHKSSGAQDLETIMDYVS
jgi:hypothetical protein